MKFSDEFVGQSGDPPRVEVVGNDGHIVAGECGIELREVPPANLTESSQQRSFGAFLYPFTQIIHAPVFDNLKRQWLLKMFKEVGYRVPGEDLIHRDTNREIPFEFPLGPACARDGERFALAKNPAAAGGPILTHGNGVLLKSQALYWAIDRVGLRY